MASTNQTTHYGLPQYIGTDQAEWTDTNTPFEEVDSDLYTAKQNADSALAGIDGVALEVNDLKVSVLGLKSSILGLRTDVDFNTANITDAMHDIDTLEVDVAKLKLDVTDLIVSEMPKKVNTFSGVVEDEEQTSYTSTAIDGIGYDETGSQLLIKLAGSDIVIPLAGGGGGGSRSIQLELTGSNNTCSVNVTDLGTGTTTTETLSNGVAKTIDDVTLQFDQTLSGGSYKVDVTVSALSDITLTGSYSGLNVSTTSVNETLNTGDHRTYTMCSGAATVGEIQYSSTLRFSPA